MNLGNNFGFGASNLYKSYIALLTQSGNGIPPSQNVKISQINNFDFEYYGRGIYRANMSFLNPNAPETIQNSISLSFGKQNPDTADVRGYINDFYIDSLGYLYIITNSDDTNSQSNGVLNNTTIELKIFI